MKETELRKWHRSFGIVLTVFFVAQAVTGMILSFENLQGHNHFEPSSGSASISGHHHEANSPEPENEIVEEIHRGGGYAGIIYRIVLGAGLIGQSAGGVLLFVVIYRRRHSHR